MKIRQFRCGRVCSAKLPRLPHSFSFQAKSHPRVTFEVDDWLAHTPRDVLAKNFGVNASLFNTLPQVDPFILGGKIVEATVSDPNGVLQGNSSYVHHASPADERKVPGGGGTFRVIDSRNFPVAKTIASAIVTLEPKGLRELHWHPNVREDLNDLDLCRHSLLFLSLILIQIWAYRVLSHLGPRMALFPIR